MDDLFIRALINAYEMTKEDAKELAKAVETVFRGRKEIEDMSVDKHIRSVFYDLHQKKLLKLRREEFKEKGKNIRKYYWSFDKQTIKEHAFRKPQIVEDPYAVYQKMPRSKWVMQIRNN